jgi:hypothetical protein
MARPVVVEVVAVAKMAEKRRWRDPRDGGVGD